MLGSRPYLGIYRILGQWGQWMGAEPQTLRTERLEGAQRERIWASAEAHESGRDFLSAGATTSGQRGHFERPRRSEKPKQTSA